MHCLSPALRHENYMKEVIFEQGRFKEHYTDVNFVKENVQHYSGGIAGVLENNVIVKRMQEASKEVLSVVYEAKRCGDLESIFIVEYRRKMNCEKHHPQFNHRNEEMTHIEFAWKLKRHLQHQLNTFPGNQHTKFWMEFEEPNNTDDSASPAYEYPKFVIYFERQFLGESLESRLQKCNTTYETKMKWLLEVLEASCELCWHVLYVQLLAEKPLLINNNRCYIDMDPILNSIFKWSFKENWLLKAYPLSAIKPKHLRHESDKVYVWRELLVDTIFQLFTNRLDSTSEELRSRLVWCRLNNNYYSLKDMTTYLDVEVFVLLTRIYKSRTLEDLKYIKETLKISRDKLNCFEILSPEPMKGGLGDVYFVLHKPTKQKHALKVLSVENLILKGLSFEQIVQNVKETSILDHPNVIKYTDIWFAEEDHGLLSYTHRITNFENEWSYVTSSAGNISDTSIRKYSTCMANSETDNEYVTVAGNLESTGDHLVVPRFLFILMEACECSLMDKVADLQTDQGLLFKYMKELLEGVIYIHGEKFMHGDLKPMNALITYDGKLVVADLDTMLEITDEKEKITLRQFRTRHYAPIEMSTKKWNEQVDYYALGITFCQMLLNGMNAREVEQILENGQLSNRGFHRQIVFLLRWLTQPHAKFRARLQDIHLIRSLLDIQSVNEFYVTERRYCFTELDGYTVSKRAKAVRASPKFTIIKLLLEKYDRRYKTVRIIEKEEIDRLDNLNWNFNTAWMLAIVNEKVTLVPQGDDYVYILYYDEKLKNKSVIHDDGNLSVLLANLANDIDSFIGRTAEKIFSKLGVTSEPDIVQVVPDELIDSELTLFWSPERMNGAIPMEENDSFACGLLCLRQLCQWVNDDDLFAATRQLQRRETPFLLECLSKSQTFVINTLCAFNSADRTSVKHLRLELTRSGEEFNDSDNAYSFNLYTDGYLYAMVVSIANDKRTQQLIAKQLCTFVSVKFLPEDLINDWKPLISKTKNMLIVDGTGDTLVEVSREEDALNIVVQLPGKPFEQLWQNKFALCERLTHIEEFFLMVYLSLSRRDRIHGSITLKKALHGNKGSCILPAFTTEEQQDFLKSHYCSLEQVVSATGSQASDIFSLGVLLYELLCMAFGLEPKLKYEFHTPTSEFQLPKQFPPQYKYLIKLMTHPEPNERPSLCTVHIRLEEDCGPIVREIKDGTQAHEFSTSPSSNILPTSSMKHRKIYQGSTRTS